MPKSDWIKNTKSINQNNIINYYKKNYKRNNNRFNKRNNFTIAFKCNSNNRLYKILIIYLIFFFFYLIKKIFHY